MKRTILCLAFGTWSLAVAAPLDDRIAAFKEAGTQTEGAVSQILQTGLQENRSAKAFAAVKPWLAANPSSSQEVLFRAGQAAERAGDWSAAVSFYRKLLQNENVPAQMGAKAVPSVYRLLINHLGDAEAAYLFMREDGARLRSFGRASQFDRWFLDKARERGDLIGLAEWHTAIFNGNDPLERFEGSLNYLLGQLETFAHGSEELMTALKSLSSARRTPVGVKARLDWVMTIVPLCPPAAELASAKKPIPADHFDKALPVAEALVKALPYEGCRAVITGWMNFNAGDSGVFRSFVTPGREGKAAPVLNALRIMSAEQAREILGMTVAQARGRRVAEYLFSKAELRALVRDLSAVFNSLSAPDVPLFDKTLTVEDAKAMAPNLARNPHEQAAMVRAWARPERNYSAAAEQMMKSEMWRFNDITKLTHGLWHSGMFERDVDNGEPNKKYAKLDARYQQIQKQVDEKASSNDRIAAFNSLLNDLVSTTPSIPGALPLWDELFSNAPDADKVTILKALTSNHQGEREYLLRRAIEKTRFGKSGSLFWQAEVYDNHFRYHQADTRKNGADLITHLEGLVRSQMAAGTPSETVFGLWLHSVDPRKPEAVKVMKEVITSPGYQKIGLAYQLAAADDKHFKKAALTPAMAAADPSHLSRELLALSDSASAAEIEAALKAAVDRVKVAPDPVVVMGLGKVAAASEWAAGTRGLVLSLFAENASLGVLPAKQGYEQLVQRILKDLAGGDKGSVESYLAGMWHAAASADDQRHYRAAEALTEFAEGALEDGKYSLAMSVARSGTRSVAGRDFASRSEENLIRMSGRLRQVTGKAAAEIGALEVPVAENDPAYPIYKSNAEFAQGNFDSAWSLYDKNAEQLNPVLRELTVEYGLWLLERNSDENEPERAEKLVRELALWSNQAKGAFSLEQDARLKISYAHLAFRKGALPTARAWYRKVADAAEYQGSQMQLEAALGSVMIDRVSQNLSSALAELDKLMLLPNPNYRMRIRYARAEVLMDQENFADALGEVEAVLRSQPKHPDALILRGKIHFEMRKLVEASEIELGPSQTDTVIVPGETVKINLRDPTLRVSGVGADIEVEIWAKSGDRERVLLYQLGDSKEKFRAEVPTSLGPPTPGDKTLQILGEDEIRFGYSRRFRAKMDDLPPDPDLVIGVASDAHLSLTAGAFEARKGERRLDISELGLSTAQAALGTRAVRPGNPVYLRVIDADRSLTPGIDEIPLKLQASSGDEIRRLVLKETGPFSGEFEAIVPTTGAQALAFASESAPGRDPNMAISSRDYPGWQGQVGDKESARVFGVDLNDNVALKEMQIEAAGLTHFVLQTSLNGDDWITRGRYPATEDVEPWDGRPYLSSFPTYRGGLAISDPEGRELPEDWLQKMEQGSASEKVNYLAAHVSSISAEELPVVNTGHPGYPGLIRYRAIFYQPSAAIRRFKLSGYPVTDEKGNKINTIFLLDGEPAGEDSDDPLAIEREIGTGLHTIEIWRNESRSALVKHKPVLLCDVPGKEELEPCPDQMFDPSTFPEGVQKLIPQAASISQSGGLKVQFGDQTQARMVRLVIQGFEGVAPSIKKVTLSNRDDEQLLPVEEDFMALRQNDQLEVLPGDQIIASYEDPVSATPKRNRHQRSLGVAFNTGTISASFLNYETNKEGERTLLLEPIRRFRMDDPVAIIIDDADLDGSPERDVIEFTATSSSGQVATLKAVETEEHSGRFLGRVFPVEGEPARSSEIQIPKGGTLTVVYRDEENLDPGIPADRAATIFHAVYAEPLLSAYKLSSKELPPPPVEESQTKSSGPEVIHPRQSLSYHHVESDEAGKEAMESVIGASLCFDVVVPHLALAGSSEIRAYIQTDAARKASANPDKVFDVTVPGTLKLTGLLGERSIENPPGYVVGSAPISPTNQPPLEEGRFAFQVPLILGDPPERSYATKSAADLPSSAIPKGLAVKAGDLVHVGFPWQDEEKKVHWRSVSFAVGSHAILDVMESGFRDTLSSSYVGEKIYLRLVAPGRDQGPERDVVNVTLKGSGGASTDYELKETEAHSGIFKAVFSVSYADDKIPSKLPPVALNGFPVRYGESIRVSYEDQSHEINVNKGADGVIEPFSKRYTGDEMAVRTSFALAECYFELAKKHREMERESLARREIGHARKLLAEALATHRDDQLKAHAEYLLGNLAQEFADLAKNDESKLPMYQDALSRFSKIPTDYPESEFAPKAQFKTALVYEKMGETENSVEEYVKLAYKYPNDELIPTVMSRLGGYFQKKGQAFKDQADAIRKNEDEESKAEVLRLDGLSYPEFLNAAMIFSKLNERFPDDPLAGLAGLRAAQNYMRAHQYPEAIAEFKRVIDDETQDGPEIRAQAIYWTGLSHERHMALMSEGDYKGRGNSLREAYQLYRRVTFDFPDSKWAKFARGRLADPIFERIIKVEQEERARMIESLKESRK